ncbi:MAG: alpha/beta fold hydrolase [Actinomycetota bacterium]
MPEATIDSTRLGYLDTGGGGEPVLLVHAFPLSSRMWGPQVEALSDRWRLIAPDLKGFGDSDAPEDPSAYSVEAYADDVAGLLDHLGLDRAPVVGLSMGGYIAFALLRRHPRRIAALVLADTRPEADPPERIEARTNQQGQVAEGRLGEVQEALIGALLAPTTLDAKPDVVARVRGLMDNPPAGYIGALEALKGRPDSTGDLARIDVPTLVVVGEEDGLAPPEAARSMHEHIGGSRLVVIPQAGHLSNLEAPDAFNGALAEFLREL